jgi:hypothetical protein
MPGHGIIVTRLFIPSDKAALGILLGDNRGFSDSPSAPYRMAIVWDTDTGEISFSVSASTVIQNSPLDLGPFGPPMFTTEPGADPEFGEQIYRPPVEYQVVPARRICDTCKNSVHVSSTSSGVKVTIAGLNSFLPVFTIHATVSVSFNGSHATVEDQGTNYPSAETIQYQAGQAPRNLARVGIGSLGSLDAVPHVSNRDVTFVDGVQH